MLLVKGLDGVLPLTDKTLVDFVLLLLLFVELLRSLLYGRLHVCSRTLVVLDLTLCLLELGLEHLHTLELLV
jgi:hypothetical protein